MASSRCAGRKAMLPFQRYVEEASRILLSESAAAKLIPPAPPKDPKQEYHPTEPVKEPEPVHDRVLTQA